MRKKKIIVTHAQVPFVNGGAELLVNSLIEELRKRDFDVDKVQIPYKWYPANSLYDNLLVWRMLDLEEVCNEKIDLVISTKFPSYGVQHSNKVTWLVHQYRQAYDLYDSQYGLAGNPEGAQIKSIVQNYDEMTLRESKEIFTISQTVTDRLQKYNGIESTPLYHPPALVGRYYDEAFEGYILSVGRLDKLKRVDLLIKALPYCDKNIKVKIAGKGSEMENLKRLAIDLHVEDRVEFLGFVKNEDLLKLYANASLIYFTPVDEDYGYITLEAFLSKKPVITCEDSGGVLEFVEDGKNGYVCKADEKEIGETINKALGNVKMLQEFGVNGYKKVKDFSWDNVIRELTKNI